jgi:hypothetical protein
MAKKKVEDYFTGAVSSPLASAPAAENLQWIPQVSPEAQLERTALVHGLDDRPPMVTQAPPDMYQQAVALDSSKEPAATTIGSFDPAFVDLTRPTTGPMARPSYAPADPTIPTIAGQPASNPTSPAFIPVPNNILKDTAGNPVMSGGNTVGLPVQNAPRGATGGGKGAGGK